MKQEHLVFTCPDCETTMHRYLANGGDITTVCGCECGALFTDRLGSFRKQLRIMNQDGSASRWMMHYDANRSTPLTMFYATDSKEWAPAPMEFEGFIRSDQFRRMIKLKAFV